MRQARLRHHLDELPRVFKTLAPWGWRLVVLVLLALPQAGIGIGVASLAGWAVEAFRTAVDGMGDWLIPALLGFFLLRSTFGALIGYISLKLSSRLQLELERRSFSALLGLPLLQTRGVGESASSLFFDTTKLSGGLLQLVTQTMMQLLQSLALWVYLVVLDWRPALLVLIVTLVIVLPLRLLTRRVGLLGEHYLDATRGYWSRAVDAAASPRLVRNFAAQEFERRSFNALGSRRLGLMLQRSRWSLLLGPLGEGFVVLVLAGALWLGIDALELASLDAATLGSAAVAVGWLLLSLRRVVGSLAPLTNTLVLHRRLRRLWSATREELAGPPPPLWSELRATGLGFAYPGAAPVFTRLDLTLRAGEHCHLSGPSGAGKTTLARLLCRLYPPTTGRLFADGRPVTDYGLSSWRRSALLVDQEPEFLPGGLLELVVYPRPPGEADLDEARRLLELVELDGLLTDGGREVNAGAVDLSGGERRRLALARALYHRPRLLVLDETTSFIDAAAEQRLLRSVRNELPGAALLVISHRERAAETAERHLRLDTQGLREV